MLDEEVSAHDTQLVLLTTLLRQPPSQDELQERIESVVQTLSAPTALADLLLLASPTTAPRPRRADDAATRSRACMQAA